MFKTHDIAEAPISSLFESNGEHLWNYVALNLHVPWFHVMYKEIEGNQTGSSSMIFLFHPEQLLNLQQQTGFMIETVDLVSPGHINGTGRWKMEPLMEIMGGTGTRRT